MESKEWVDSEGQGEVGDSRRANDRADETAEEGVEALKEGGDDGVFESIELVDIECTSSLLLSLSLFFRRVFVSRCCRPTTLSLLLLLLLLVSRLFGKAPSAYKGVLSFTL